MKDKLNFVGAFAARTKTPILGLVALIGFVVLLVVAAPAAIALLVTAAFLYLFFLIYKGDAKVLKAVAALLAIVNWFVSLFVKLGKKIQDYVHTAADGASADAAVKRADDEAIASTRHYAAAVEARSGKAREVSEIDLRIFELDLLRQQKEAELNEAEAKESAARDNYNAQHDKAEELAIKRDEDFPRKPRRK